MSSIHRVQHTQSPAYTESSIHRVQHTPSTVYTEYCIHRVVHYPRIDCHQLPASLSSRVRPCCTQLSTLSQLQVNQWIESQFPSRLPTELPPPDWSPPCTPAISLNDALQLHLQTCSIMASKCISKPAGLLPPSASRNSPDHGLQVHLQTHSITASKCICKLGRLRPPSSHNHGLHVHLQTRLITASKCISKLARSGPRSASLSSLDHSVVKWWR